MILLVAKSARGRVLKSLNEGARRRGRLGGILVSLGARSSLGEERKFWGGSTMD